MARNSKPSLPAAPSRSTPLAVNPFFPPQDGRCIMNELPAELLSHIFILGAQEDEDKEDDTDDGDVEKDDGDSDFEDVDSDEGEANFGKGEANWEILVSHICKRWRDVAIEVPQLWSTLAFMEDTPLEQPGVYLERSKAAPVSISIDFTNDDNMKIWNRTLATGFEAKPIELMTHFRAILELIRPHLSHTSVLEVMVTLWKYMQATLKLLGECPSAPILDILQLYHYEDGDDDDDDDDFDLRVSPIPPTSRKQDFVLFHGNAPALTQVALWGVHVNWAKSTFLSGLTDLELSYHEEDLRPTYKEFARILKESPKLELLTISQSGPEGGPVDWLTSITDGAEGAADLSPSVSTLIDLPSVKEFVLAYVDATYATALMERLIFTSLTSLTLDLEQDDFTEFFSTLAKPHRVTGKSILAGLTSLALGGVGDCRKHAVYELYAVLGNADTLHLNFGYISKDWYQALLPGDAASTQSHGINVPRLDTLYSTELTGEELNKLLTARAAAGVPISRLFVNRFDNLTEEEEKWLQKEAGLVTFEFFDDSDDETDDGRIIELEMDEDDDDHQWVDDDDDDLDEDEV